MQGFLGDNINLTPWKVLEVEEEATQVEEIAARVKFYQDINVTFVGGVAPGNRAKQPYIRTLRAPCSLARRNMSIRLALTCSVIFNCSSR